MSEDPYTISFEPIEEPSIESGDAVTVYLPDGVTRSLLVMKVEPLYDENGRAGQSIDFIAWPES